MDFGGFDEGRDGEHAQGDTPCVLDMDNAATVANGVEDTYGMDRATEEQLVMPWAVSVAR